MKINLKLDSKSLSFFLVLLLFNIVVYLALPGNVLAKAPNEIKFFGSPRSSIASAVAVPENQSYFWTSGTVPPLLNRNAPTGSRERYGDTKTQAIGTLKRIETQLKQVGLDLSDIVYLRVYITPDKFKNNEYDYRGWFEAYSQFFNNQNNPRKVARSTVGVGSLVVPDWLIEIEAVAVYPRK